MTVKPPPEAAAPEDELDDPEPTRGKLDLSRYQVATIPTDVQMDLATLRRPLLSDEALKPPPPISQVQKSSPVPPSDAPVTDNTFNKEVGHKRVWTYVGAGVGLALLLVGWSLGHYFTKLPTPAGPTVPVSSVAGPKPLLSAVSPSRESPAPATVPSSACAPPTSAKAAPPKLWRATDKLPLKPEASTTRPSAVKPLIDPIFKAE
jgi:hypothetical protein